MSQHSTLQAELIPASTPVSSPSDPAALASVLARATAAARRDSLGRRPAPSVRPRLDLSAALDPHGGGEPRSGEGAAGPLLDSNGKFSSGSVQDALSEGSLVPLTDDVRRVRWAARSWLWGHSKLRGVKACGRCRRAEVTNIGVRQDSETGRAGYAGLQACGSVWVCPVCNSKIMAERAMEIGAAIETWLSSVPSVPPVLVRSGPRKGQEIVAGIPYAPGRRGRLVFATFTLRHSAEHSLNRVWEAVLRCWQYMASGRRWVHDRDVNGVAGFLRVTEVTVSWRNGWHVHFHVLIFIEPTFTGSLDKLADSMWERWEGESFRLGHEAVRDAQDWQVVTYGDTAKLAFLLSRYVSKAQYFGESVEGRQARSKMGQELTNTQSKKARSALSTRSTWELLHDARGGVDGSMVRWWEWEAASKGKQAQRWSPGLRKRLGLGDERDDKAVAEDETGTVDDTVAWITPAGWVTLVKGHLMVKGLEALEVGGRGGLLAFFVKHGVEHELVNPD